MSWKAHFEPKVACNTGNAAKLKALLLKNHTIILDDCMSSTNIKLLGTGLRDVLSYWEKEGGTLSNNAWSQVCTTLSTLLAQALHNHNESTFVAYSKLLLFCLSKCKAFVEGEELVEYLLKMASALQDRIDKKPSNSTNEAIGKLLVYLIQAAAEQFGAYPECPLLHNVYTFSMQLNTLQILAVSVSSTQHDTYFAYLLDNSLSWALHRAPDRIGQIFAAQLSYLPHVCQARQFDMILRYISSTKEAKTKDCLCTAFASHLQGLTESSHTISLLEVSKLALAADYEAINKELLESSVEYISRGCKAAAVEVDAGWTMSRMIVSLKAAPSRKTKIESIERIVNFASSFSTLEWDLFVKLMHILLMNGHDDTVIRTLQAMRYEAHTDAWESGIYKLFVTLIRYGVQMSGLTEVLLKVCCECVTALAAGSCQRQTFVDNLLKLNYTALRLCDTEENSEKYIFIGRYNAFLCSLSADVCDPALVVGLSSHIASKWDTIGQAECMQLMLNTIAFIEKSNKAFVSERKYFEKLWVNNVVHYMLSNADTEYNSLWSCSISFDGGAYLFFQLVDELRRRLSHASSASIEMLNRFDCIASFLLKDSEDATLRDVLTLHAKCHLIVCFQSENVVALRAKLLDDITSLLPSRPKKTGKNKKANESRHTAAEILAMVGYLKMSVSLSQYTDSLCVTPRLIDVSSCCDMLNAALLKSLTVGCEVAYALFHYYALCADLFSQQKLLDELSKWDDEAVSPHYLTLRSLLQLQRIVHGVTDGLHSINNHPTSKLIDIVLSILTDNCSCRGMTLSEFEMTADEAYASYRNDATMLACWIALASAKYIFLFWNSCSKALSWAKRCLALTGLNAQCVDFDYILPAFECTLLIAEIHESTGSLDRCQAYIAESRLLATSTAIPLLHGLHGLHCYRLGHRLQQTKLMHDSDITNITSEFFPMNSDFENLLLNTMQEIKDCDRRLPTISFRYTKLMWDTNGACEVFHTPLNCNARKVLRDTLMHTNEIYHAQLSGVGSTSEPLVRDNFLLTSDFFDITRSYRKLCCTRLLSNVSTSLDKQLAYIFGSSACCTSLECSLETQADTSPPNPYIPEAASLIRSALTGDSSSQEKIFSLLTANATRVSCFVALDTVSKALLIGRASSSDNPIVIALPIYDAVSKQLESWKHIIEQNRSQLRSSCDIDSKVDKVAWWDERVLFEGNIESSLSELEKSIGVWRCLFAPSGLCDHNKLQNVIKEHVSSIVGKSNKKCSAMNVENISSVLSQWSDVIFSPYAGLSADEITSAIHYLCDRIFEPAGINCGAQRLAAMRDSIRRVFDESTAPCDLLTKEMADMSMKFSASAECASYGDMKVTELKNELKNLGLSTTGKKADLVERLTTYYAAESGMSMTRETTKEVLPLPLNSPHHHIVIMCDEALQMIPWECLPVLRNRNCSRIPGLCALLSLQLRLQNTEKCIHPQRGWYAVDPEDNLPQTRKTMESFLDPYAKRWQWQGCVGEIPTEDFVRNHHENSDMFIYCGHGAGEKLFDRNKLKKTKCPAAMLWGCSSGALTRHGIHDPNGAALAYLMGGAPWTVGNLWDVTDKDIDKLSMSCMKKLLEKDGGISESLYLSRNECKMKFANGCAPVIYGLPDDVTIVL